MSEAGHLETRHPFSPIRGEDSVQAIADVIPSQSQCPRNVSPKAWGFLGVAREGGALGELTKQPNGDRKVEVLGLFIGEELSLRQIVARLEIASKNIRYLVLDGVEKVWQSLPPDVQQQFPLEKIKSLRELHNPEWK